MSNIGENKAGCAKARALGAGTRGQSAAVRPEAAAFVGSAADEGARIDYRLELRMAEQFN